MLSKPGLALGSYGCTTVCCVEISQRPPSDPNTSLCRAKVSARVRVSIRDSKSSLFVQRSSMTGEMAAWRQHLERIAWCALTQTLTRNSTLILTQMQMLLFTTILPDTGHDD